MADRPVAIEGPNLVLVILLTLLWLALGLLLIGPGRSRLAQADHAISTLDAEQSDWEDEFGDVQPPSEADMRSWQDGFSAMNRFGPPTVEEPGLTAWVANQLRAPSVRGLEVNSSDAAPQSEVSDRIELRSPSADEALSLRMTSTRVRFYALYEDVVAVLSRIESDQSAMKIIQIKLKRSAPEIRVDLDLALWTRAEGAS